ncbi:MAG: methyl-accepting chemotaxis protein [Pseudochelatococcus sp.]|jgi:methyl-accepting chemotaxis protein|uniref:methyl-accepting chemotaxis protein n=1 Tax=Pseudochelatococcus sp. TaxID=2020869 RepID=UPI003D8C508E
MAFSGPAIGIRGRLWLAFGVISTLPILAALVAWLAFNDVAERMDQVAQRRLPQIEAALRLAATAERLVGYGPQIVAAPGADAREAIWRRVDPIRDEGRSLIEALRGTTDAVEITDYISYIDDMSRMLTDIHNLVNAIGENRAEFVRLMQKVEPAAGDFDRVAEQLDDIEAGALLGQLNVKLVGALLGLPVLTDLDAVDRARAGVEEHRAELVRLVGGLEAADAERIAPVRDAWLAVLDAQPFQMQSDFLLDGEDRDLLLVSNATVAERLRERTAGLVADASNGARAAAADVRTVIADGVWKLFGVAIGAVVLAIAIGWLYVNRLLIRSLTRLIDIMRRLSQGEREIAIPDLHRRDEIGAMAAALEVFKQNAIERHHLEENQRHASEAQAQRVDAVEALIRDFDDEMVNVLALIRASSESLESTARSLNTTADASSGNVVNVSTAAEQASANVQNVASASEQLAASINEISRQISDSRQIADQALASVRETDGTARQLLSASERINEIVALISTIAQQTNLLALNATIEAARAGNAGKGFAVVASEVKSLADQTERATGDISEHLRAIQTVSQTAVSAIHGVGEIIERINVIFSEISQAVSQQGAATREIAESVQQAATGTQQVSVKMRDISQGVSDTRQHAADVLGSASGLAKEAQGVRHTVERFFDEIRAA